MLRLGSGVAGDQLYDESGSLVAVVSIQATGEIATVYNFTVEGLYNYFVADDSSWVLAHNATRRLQYGVEVDIPDDADSQTIVGAVARGIRSQGADDLEKKFSKEMARAAKRKPWLRKAFLGSQVHYEIRGELNLLYPGRFEYRSVGPDYKDKQMNDALVELTTTNPHNIKAHTDKGGDYLTCAFAGYDPF